MVALTRGSSSPMVTSTRSTSPAGDSPARKYGLRVNTARCPGSMRSIRYGPVPGAGWDPKSRCGVLAGTTAAIGTASFCGRSGSGRLRRIAMVPVRSSVAIPRERSQRRGIATHRGTPSTAPNTSASALPWIAARRSIEARKSLARTGVPSLKRRPGRRRQHIAPAAVGRLGHGDRQRGLEARAGRARRPPVAGAAPRTRARSAGMATAL